MIDQERGRVYAVLDPLHKGNREMIDALGTDAVEMEAYHPDGPDCPPVLRVKLRALPEARVIAACRLIARRTGIPFEDAYVWAVMIEGIGISAVNSYLCADPEVGRDYFAMRESEAGP